MTAIVLFFSISHNILWYCFDSHCFLCIYEHIPYCFCTIMLSSAFNIELFTCNSFIYLFCIIIYIWNCLFIISMLRYWIRFYQIKLFSFLLLKSGIYNKTPGISNFINDRVLFVCYNFVLCNFYSVRVMSLLATVFLYSLYGIIWWFNVFNLISIFVNFLAQKSVLSIRKCIFT